VMLACRLRDRLVTGKIVGVSLRLSPTTDSVSDMLTISEDQFPMVVKDVLPERALASHGLKQT
jgi:hypothetical protein